jgi:hemoglobin-like flavoprotein
MLPEQERLVRESWLELERNADPASRLFYARLFELDESARELFHRVDMDSQGAKFIAMLGSIVRSLDEAPRLVSGVATLGRRHAHYGARTQHYESVGAALIWTLEHVLGDRFTPEMRGAWTEAYALLAAVMRRASASTGEHTAPPAVRTT